MNMRKLLLRTTCTVILFSSWHSSVHACGSVLTTPPVISFTGVIPVQRDAPLGSLIALGQTPIRANVLSVGKAGATHVVQLFTQGVDNPAVTYNGIPVRKTNLSGVGITFWSNVDPTPTSPQRLDGLATTQTGIDSGTIYYALVKTKNTVQTGTLNAKAFDPAYVCLGVTNSIYYNTPINITGNAVIQEVACSVTTPLIDVSLGTVRRNIFTGNGSVSDNVDFSIPLNCRPGTRMNIKISSNGNSSDDVTNGVIGINAPGQSGNASGLGVQILYNGSPIQLNNDIALGVTAQEGPISIPFSARYYQIGSNAVTAGTANATATFTMTYR